MTTMAAMRTRVRTRLEEATPAIWTDAEIDEGIAGALDSYSWLFPKEATAPIAVPADTTSTPAPTGAIDIRRVILADGSVAPKRAAPRERTSDEELAWELYAGSILFTHPLSAQTLTVWYTTAMTLADLPPSDEGLIVLGGVAQALEARAVQDFKRAGPLANPAYDAVIRRARADAERELNRRRRHVRSAVITPP